MQRLCVILLLAFALLIGSAAAQKKKPCGCKHHKDNRTIGMVADYFGSVSVFDADSDTLIGSVRIPGGTWDTYLFDCAITKDRKLGFVADFNVGIWVIDLTQNPPALASGTNPIPLSTGPDDLSLSPDGKFLVVSDGYSRTGRTPIVVIDIATRTPCCTFWLGPNTSACAVEVCPDGSVLVAERTTQTTTQIRRLHIDSFGNLTDTNELIGDSEAPAVFNLLHVQSKEEGNNGEIYGIFISLRMTYVLGSFRVQGMKMLSTVTMTNPWAVDGAVSPRGNRVFVREDGPYPGNTPGPGAAIIEVFQFHADEGRIGKLKSTIPLDQIAGLWWGVDQMAIHPNGKKLYVSGLALPEVRVFDANKGDLLSTMKIPPIGQQTWVTGITVVGPERHD